MRKFKLLLILTLGLFASCDREVKPGDMYYNTGDGSDANDMQSTKVRYFKDKRTNKCFAERGTSDSYSFTCVECDSLVLNQIQLQKED